MDILQTIAYELKLHPDQVAATVALFDEGNTLPFIARYRKERTGSLDEEQLRSLQTMLESLRALEERRQAIIASIDEQGKLTPELLAQIQQATTRTELEDLYLPYKPKRRTRASIAREKGLQGLADLILAQGMHRESISDLVAPYLNDEVPSEEEALAGARDIVAEQISDHPEVRGETRAKALEWAVLRSERIDAGEDPRGTYQTYYEFEGLVGRLKPYQVLALNRGEQSKVLRVSVDVPERDWRNAVARVFVLNQRSPFATELTMAIYDSAQRLLLPAIERDVRRTLTEQAELHAIHTFADNLRGLLSQPPLSNQVILGLDPGYRTGCKVAVVDSTGKVLDTATIYPHEPQRQKDQAIRTLLTLINRHNVTLIAIGNGTASRETEQLAAELIKQVPQVRYLMVSEAGASVYSASSLARSELPDLDVSLRGGVSIARRVLDPLAELVKIDPQSIGVGLYQHDVDQKQLSESLGGVVESVVNQVGVDVNVASPMLLTYVSGIGPKLANNIVAYRDEHGPFPSRKSLRNVSGLGPKAFEQAAGFLRIRDGDNPLDASAIHPESYRAAEQVLKLAGLSMRSSLSERGAALKALTERSSLADLAQQLEIGVPTLQDILEQLVRPGRDPREDLPAPILRQDVLSLKDLKVGMRLKGTVRNVVDFGAFVDIGLKNDGLLHRSQTPRGTTLHVGDIVEVEILSIEQDRGRIALAWVARSSA
jgi:uncharacterized protein